MLKSYKSEELSGRLMYPVDILLATYNGERYLDQQITSILEQQYGNWRLIIRDDGSTDSTLQIISKYAQSYPEKIQLLDDTSGRLGPSGSFDKLLQFSTAPYIAFCDQDDVWLPGKLQLLKNHMVQVENRYGSEFPVLVHTDLEVVDEGLNTLADSFWLFQKINPSKMQSLERLLVQNCVTGCATMVNRPLVNCALPIPPGAIMHDWWLALLAVSLGKIESIDTATVRYRQHTGNDTGAKKWGLRFVLTGVLKTRKHYRDGLLKTREQAIALIDSGRLYTKQNETVSNYIGLYASNWFNRRIMIARMGFYKYGLIRNIALMLWV